MTFEIGDTVEVLLGCHIKGYEGVVVSFTRDNCYEVEFHEGIIYEFDESSLKLIKKKSDTLPEGVKGKGDLSHKPHLAYIDPHLEYEMGMGMRFGAGKHGWNNHRKLGVEASLHILDSLKRHLNAYLRGEQIDPESGVHHLACLMNNANFIYRLDRLHGYESVLQNVYGEIK